MFSRARKATAFEVEVLIPQPEDMMLVTLMNLYHRLMEGPYDIGISKFYCFYDIIKTITITPDMNWDLIIDTAVEQKMIYQVRIVLELLNELWPFVLPKELLDKIKPHKIDSSQFKMDRLKAGFMKDEAFWHGYKCRSIRDIINGVPLFLMYLSAKMIQKNAIVRFLFLDLRYFASNMKLFRKF